MQQDWTPAANPKDANTSVVGQPEASGSGPSMDHWNVPRPHVSLRDIIKEEQALQENVQKVTEGLFNRRHIKRNRLFLLLLFILTSVGLSLCKTRQSRADLDRRDGATLLKEKQLFALFPTIDRHFLQDIFRDHK